MFEDVIATQGLDKNTDKIPKQTFLNYYRQRLESKPPNKRVFEIISSSKDRTVIKPDDLKPLFRHLLDTHPGLEFL